MGAGEGCGGKTRARAKKDRKYIPAMPMPVAVICCIFNFLVPGLGTILAGLCVCCCARTEDMSCCEQFGSFCLSIIIGLLQLVLAPVLLVGWVWSCFWGVSFIGMSKEYYHDNKPFDDEQVNTVVTNQPGPSGYHPGQWSSPPGGPYSAQPGPGPGYPQGAGYQGQSVPHGQFAHNSPMPTAPPEEHEYLPPSAPAGYPEAPPPYQIDDPHPHSNPHKH